MLIACPSKSRAGRITSDRVVPTSVLFVPANEVRDYEATSSCKVVAVPSTVRGITPTRNWILEYAAATGIERVVFVDDDARFVGWFDVHARHMRRRRLGADAILSEFERFFDLTEEMGYRLWGVKTESAARSYYPYKPFLTRTYVTASCCGMFSAGPRALRFDERFVVKEDYELCLRAMKEDGGILGIRYITWENDHWTMDGGCKDYRTSRIEADCIRLLQKLYPGVVQHKPSASGQYTIKLNL